MIGAKILLSMLPLVLLVIVSGSLWRIPNGQKLARVTKEVLIYKIA
jgi:hypothetical protein